MSSLDIDWDNLGIEKSEPGADEPVEKLNTVLDDRSLKLQQFFRDSFGKNPDYIVKVPGRVNLIGEHVDYSGYGVLPMALEQTVLLALSGNGTDKTTLMNMDKKYEKAVIGDTFSGCTKPLWYHYFQCGIQGALTYSDAMKYRGMDVAVEGNIPVSAGLSSSSAMVCAAAICVFLLNEPDVHPPGKKEMADLCAKAENLIGTQGGGMDQAIAFLAREGCAKHIEFNPLRCVDIQLPENAVFVIAHSMVEKNKAASNDFNIRVVECRLAAQVMAKIRGLEWRKVKKLKDLQELLKVNPREMVQILETTIIDKAYSKEEIATILEISVEDLMATSLSPDTKDVDTFELKKRARHVYQEVARVLEFKYDCQTLPADKCIVKLGKLLQESHESLKNSYQCSHEQLDQLVKLSEAYTYGARLTGAGWGGCIVALTTAERVDDYMAALKAKYYFNLGVKDLEFGSYVFVTTPKCGARVYDLKSNVGSGGTVHKVL